MGDDQVGELSQVTWTLNTSPGPRVSSAIASTEGGALKGHEEKVKAQKGWITGWLCGALNLRAALATYGCMPVPAVRISEQETEGRLIQTQMETSQHIKELTSKAEEMRTELQETNAQIKT